MKNYLKLDSDNYCDLSGREVIIFAFEYAVILNMKIPGVWSDMIETGTERFTDLLKRQTRLSRANLMQKITARASRFNKTNVIF